MNGPIKMNDADELVEMLEHCWRGVLGSADRTGCNVDRSRRIPFLI